MIGVFLLKIWYEKAETERVNRVAVEEVYHNLAIEANKIQEKTKVVTRYIEKPDGTKVTEKVEEKDKIENSSKVVDESSDKKKETIEQVPDKPHYSITALGPIKGTPSYEEIGVYFGFRVWDMPVELLLGGRPFNREAEGGLRYEW